MDLSKHKQWCLQVSAVLPFSLHGWLILFESFHTKTLFHLSFRGLIRCGFAKSQKAYDKAIDDLTMSFDRLEEILSRQRFIAGDRVTLSDIRLFVTLLRFDEVYTVYFKCDTRSVASSPALLNYCREIYQMPGVAETVNMQQIKEHYYCSHPDLNKYSIISRGRNFEKLLQEPHDRESTDAFKRRRVSPASLGSAGSSASVGPN